MDRNDAGRVPESPSSPEPETLIGRLILAFALDDTAQMATLRTQLSRSGWHHADSVIITTAYSVVNLRWPAFYESDEVREVVSEAVAMAPRSEAVNPEAVETVVRLALGEQVPTSISSRAKIAHRLFVVWAFARQLGLSRDTIASMVVDAERLAMSRGFTPTTAAG